MKITMKFSTTLILLVVLVVLGGYVYWSGRGQASSTSDGTPTPEHVTVVRLNATDVSAIVVRDKDGKQVRAERDGTTWKLTAPVADPGDTARISSLADQLTQLQATRIITPTSQDLAPFGLTTPTYDIQLLKGTMPLAELKLGTKNPDGSATYVQLANSPTIYLSSDISLDTATGWISDPPVQPTAVPTLPPTVAPATQTPAISATPTTPATFPSPTPLLGLPTQIPGATATP